MQIEPAIPARKRPQTYAFDGAAAGTQHLQVYYRESERIIVSLKTQITRS